MSTFSFDDRVVDYRDGQSVGAALIAAGTYSWRITAKSARPRGIFCGIGVCYDCLITVDGVPNQRACLVEASAGLRVTSQLGTGREDLAR
jgi:hypothetical protein